MQRSAVVVVADKTSLKRPFIFTNAVHMALCFFMLMMTIAWHRDLVQTGKLVSVASVVIMYIMEIGCLLLSVLGIFGACKGKRWCLILVKMLGIHVLQICIEIKPFFLMCCRVCGQYAAGMAAASQTIIIRTALSYQDLYEVSHCYVLCVLRWADAKRVVREESKLLSMMPLTGTSKANRTLLYSIQKEIRLRGIATLGAPKNQYVYQQVCDLFSLRKLPLRSLPSLPSLTFAAAPPIPQPCLPVYVSELKLAFSLAMAIQFGSGVFWAVLLVMSIKLMGQMKRKQEFMALLQSNRYVPGAF
ncbi:unnamed protein product [Tetraodon nigroviridis]|uniref:(spotted green pufferfish) hypothetical protein n=1 Tax=Tetraodon nigroviridis TaxID=99883 RepID=Q4RHN7_TETNG|nr:unnamed protein product [Tetraodon nigroviridis]